MAQGRGPFSEGLHLFSSFSAGRMRCSQVGWDSVVVPMVKPKNGHENHGKTVGTLENRRVQTTEIQHDGGRFQNGPLNPTP